jgi:ribulose-5-phosphate 4-epimerase/fuculose-1-phosphate aldolase
MMRAAQLLEQVAAHFELYGDAVLHRHAAALTALSLAHGLLFERIGHTCIAN